MSIKKDTWTSPHGRPLPKLGGKCVIMGILNLTPDSFSDGGKFTTRVAALAQFNEMIAQGAKIIDIGAESTRPSAVKISAKDELKRLIPMLKFLRTHNADIPISVDTYKPEVAELALREGADIINDVVSLVENSDGKERFPMAEIAAKIGAPIIITHNMRDDSAFYRAPQTTVRKRNFGHSFLSDLKRAILAARAEGVPEKNIILDPGIGFGKTVEQNFELVKNVRKYFGYPVLLGVSRKSLFAEYADGQPDLLEVATAAISAIVARAGSAQILRVHDVQKNALAVRLGERLKKSATWTK